jgi:CPA1 family monovalent cation:H+ antiporter
LSTEFQPWIKSTSRNANELVRPYNVKIFGAETFNVSSDLIQTVEIVGGVATLLLLGSAMLAVSKRLKLPFTVALLLAGTSLSWGVSWPPHPFGAVESLRVSPDIVIYVFLPTLIFEAALHFDTRQLRRDLKAILTLAVPGLLLSTFLVGGIVALTTTIPFSAALLLGAILSATDPVAVIALFKEVGAPQRLTVLVEGESLFNDATSIVLARILVAVVVAGTVSVSGIGTAVWEFLLLFIGGLTVGVALGFGVGYLLGKVESDPSIEITLTTVLAYMSFLIAEELLGVSGIMATIGAGLVQGGWGRLKVSVSVRAYLDRFWDYMAFIANALIFLMVGLRVDLSALLGVMHLLPWVVLAILVARAAVMYGLLPLSERLWRQEPIDLRYRTIMFWGGLRGAVALALALGLPMFQYNEEFVALVMGVVLFTLLVQATSIRFLIGILGLDQAPLTERLAHMEATLTGRHAAMQRIDQLEQGGLFSGRIADDLRKKCDTDIKQTQSQIAQLRWNELDAPHERQLIYLHSLAIEKSLLQELFNQGHLSENAFRELDELLSSAADSVRHHQDAPNVTRAWTKNQPWIGSLTRRVSSLLGLGRLHQRWQMARLARDYEKAWSLDQGCKVVLDKLTESLQMEGISQEREREIREQYQRWRDSVRWQLDQTAEQFPEFVTAAQQRMGQRLLLLAESDAVRQQANLGLLPPGSAEQRLTHIDQQRRRLRGQRTDALRTEPTELLRKLPFLKEMPAEKFTHLAEHMQAKHVARKETVIHQGDTGSSMFFIARGVMRVIREDDQGKHELRSLLAGDFFGEIALLHDVRRTASVQAVTPGVLYELKREDVIEAMRTCPEIHQAIEQADRQRADGLFDQGS